MSLEWCSSSYVEGVSTRRVDDVAKAMGVEGISKSQVSRICGELDETVEQWRNRPLDAGPDPFMWISALVLKAREGGRIVNTSALGATAVNAEARREIVGLELRSAETGASWTAFLRGLFGRPAGGLRRGLKDAIAAVVRLVGVVLAEQHGEWQIGRRYMTQSTIREARITIIDIGRNRGFDTRPERQTAIA